MVIFFFQIFQLKCTKFNFGLRPCWGIHSASQTPQLDLKKEGKGEKEKGKERGKGGEWGHGEGQGK